MNEVTPDLIAAIATRLYNEIPGANLVPKTESDLPQALPETMLLPSGSSEVPFGGITPPAFPQFSPDAFSVTGMPGIAPGLPNVPGGVIGTPESLGAPGTAGIGSHGYSIPPVSDVAPGDFSPEAITGIAPEWRGAPGAAASTTDGLSAFVQKIRAGQIRNETGQCAVGHDQDLLQQLFRGKTAPETGARPLDIPAIRKDFPALNQSVHGKQLAWMDNGATTQKPQSVIDAISRFYENDNSNIHRGAHTLAARATDAFEQARQKVQTFLGASSSKDIVFVRGTTEGINLVAQTYGRKFLQPGDEIILSTLEHHANIVPWQMIAKEKGAVIRVIPVNDQGEVMLEAYQALLGPRTKLVALTQASNSLGTILPVAEMTKAAKRYNARVLIDGAQSVSHMPVNMQEIGCDFFVFSGHKIFAPTGIGAVYINEQLHEILPPWHGGGNMIKNVTFEETTYNEAPAKFEAGTPNIADAVGLGAALDYVNRLGLVNTGNYEHKLLEYATEQLSRISGLRLIGGAREKVAVISFVLKERKTEEVGRLLDQEGIAVRAGHHCAQPSLRRFGVEATVRPSFAFYNTFDEIDRLVDAVRRIQRV
jgi:cysteine desulfurase / selenocysteine lyase